MSMQFQSVTRALTEYDRQQDAVYIQKAQEEREEMRHRFPLEKWPEMTLEQYAIGQSDSADTYSYWLEFGTPHIGSMRGAAPLSTLFTSIKINQAGITGHPMPTNRRHGQRCATGLCRCLNWRETAVGMRLGG